MTSRLSVLLDRLRAGIWPIPLGMLVLAVVLYRAMLWVDLRQMDGALLTQGWLHRGSGDDARNLLSTLLTAIITMSSIVFSITIVALTLAANQFGSRLVRTYVSDGRTKLALGLFAMTIVYCLLALGGVEQAMTPEQVPHVTVTLGSALALTCVLALLFFLHLIARSLVADEVIRRVARELEENVDALPQLAAVPHEPSVDDVLPQDFYARSMILRSRKEGYVEAVDYERMLAAAVEHELVLRLDFRAGAFMCRNGWLASVYPGDRLTPHAAVAIRAAILIGPERTPTQDLEFSVRHLVDIALRALSPGINDANTALVVIDRLRGALSRLMAKSLPTAVCRDRAGRVRIVGKYNSYAGVLDSALHQIRQAAKSHPAVIINLLGALGRIAEHALLPEQREALLAHAKLVAEAGLRHVEQRQDRIDIEEAFLATKDKLERIVPEVGIFEEADIQAPGTRVVRELASR